jgi:hypothetical protein
VGGEGSGYLYYAGVVQCKFATIVHKVPAFRNGERDDLDRGIEHALDDSFPIVGGIDVLKDGLHDANLGAPIWCLFM